MSDLKVLSSKNRYKGKLPKVGIRPTIDGRQGELKLRDSLEEQTMSLAKACAEFISKHLTHPSGEPVECIIADTTIGGVAEAAACAAKFEKEGVGVSLTVTPCWCYGSETMDMNPLVPKAVWGFNGTERPGAVYLAAVLAAYTQKGLPAFSIYGRDVMDAGDYSIPEDVAVKILRFVKAGLAVSWMKGKSYLAIGGTSMGIGGSIVDPNFLEEYLGMRAESVDMSELARRIAHNIYDGEEFDKAYAWVKENVAIGEDTNELDKQHTPEQKEAALKESIQMAIIAKDLMVGNPKLHDLGFEEEAMGHNAIAGGFQGQRHWTDWRANGDFMETMLNSSFDWNGIRQPYTMATENDVLNGMAMLFGSLMTGSAQIFADVRTYWSPDAIKRVTGYEVDSLAAHGLIHLINSGSAALDGTGQQSVDGNPAIKQWWNVTPKETDDCLKASEFCYANLGYFRGGGFSTKFATKGFMPVTMSRINLVKGLGPVLQIAEGFTVELPEDAHEILTRRTDYTWPTTWFAPRITGEGSFKDTYSVMANWGANHGSLCYGHVGAEMITLAAMLRIPVSMHNVNENDIFRPTAWASFGSDKEGSDYRACDVYGPLYK